MSLKTYGLIAKCLHDDHRKSVTDAELREAHGAFTEWRKDAQKAARR